MWVDERKAIDVHLQNYKNIIYLLLSHYQYVADLSKNVGFTSGLVGLRILEEGKENLGKLRANMSAIFAKNAAINEITKNKIIDLYSGVNSNLKSPVVSLSNQSQQLVNNLFSQTNFKTVEERYKLILENSNKGNFGVDVGIFFPIISSAISDLKSLIHGELDYINKELIQSKISMERWKMLAVSIFGVIVFAFITALCGIIIKHLTTTLLNLTESLESSYSVVQKEANGIAETSVRLAELATENSSAVQETASSVEEISSMVNNNVNEAEKSKKTVDDTSEISSLVGSKMSELTDSMRSIVKSNEEITGLIKIFDEISEKTKIIDDIVFQTKILSFNASVEAERAGEHGRGFSVVASEVSNLALMSGKAAMEISNIVKESTKSAENVVQVNKEKVLKGNEILSETSAAISSIIESLSKINKNSDQILVSSKDQASGISQVNDAINEIDLATQQTVSLADYSSLASKQLQDQADKLGRSVEALNTIIQGDETKGGGSGGMTGSSLSNGAGDNHSNKQDGLGPNKSKTFSPSSNSNDIEWKKIG